MGRSTTAYHGVGLEYRERITKLSLSVGVVKPSEEGEQNERGNH